MLTVDMFPIDRHAKQVGDYIWIRCPFHSGGQERTPSLKIDASGRNGRPLGYWFCFGCGSDNHGPWKRLAKTLGMKSGDDELYVPPSLNLDKFLDETDEDDRKEYYKKLADFPDRLKWRGISGKLLSKLKSKYVLDTTPQKIYLPFFVNKEFMGGVKCSMDGSEPKYDYDRGIAIQSTMFPFDYVKRKKPDYVVLVEGPRDALNLLQHGIYALANLGGHTVWHEDKAELVSSLELDFIITAFDPDKVGKKLTIKAKESLKNHVYKMSQFKMRPEKVDDDGKTIREKEDPGNLSAKRVKQLEAKIERLRSKIKDERAV